MINKKSTFLAFGLLIATLSLLGLGCKGGDLAAQERGSKKITLNWWRVEDGQKEFADIVADYKITHPNIDVKIKTLKAEELNNQLLEALASGKGPDLVSVPNNSLKQWQDKIVALPDKLTMPYIEMTGFIKKEPTWILKDKATLSLRNIQENYVDVVFNDVVIDSKIYGLPTNLDSLVLYYNRTLLSSAGVANPPSNWTEFKEATQRITQIDKGGVFIQNGTALGEADNVPYAQDILAALMLQNGTSMTTNKGDTATFQNEILSDGQKFYPGIDAVRFYTDFSNPTKETYSWTKDESGAWQALAAGKLGFVFGYWRDYKNIKKSSPKIELGLANFPQIEGSLKPTYFANYYIDTVTKQSKYQTEAWDFLLFTSQTKEIQKYIKNTQRLTAHRALVNKQIEDPELGVPAKQLLTSKSWYHGYKPEAADNAFLNLIKQVVAGTDIEQAISFASKQITQTLRSK